MAMLNNQMVCSFVMETPLHTNQRKPWCMPEIAEVSELYTIVHK